MFLLILTTDGLRGKPSKRVFCDKLNFALNCYIFIFFNLLLLDCYISVLGKTKCWKLLPSPKDNGFQGQHHQTFTEQQALLQISAISLHSLAKNVTSLTRGPNWSFRCLDWSKNVTSLTQGPNWCTDIFLTNLQFFCLDGRLRTFWHFFRKSAT